MKVSENLRRWTIAVLAAAVAACATNGAPPVKWAAHGYLTPGPNDDPEIIGAYDSQAECRAAVEAWTSRQVVGNPVSGDCLPIDRH